MTVTNLNIFQSGTIASVVPVNENFETLRVAVNSVEQTAYEQKIYLNNKVEEINEKIEDTLKTQKCSGEVFCVNEGNFDENGEPCILNVSSSGILSFITPFIATNINGESFSPIQISDISISDYTEGNYNVFVDLDSGIEIIANNIYRTSIQPEGVLNDVWLDISKVPLTAKKLTTNGWENFEKIPLGSFSVAEDGTITCKTFSYNQNGYKIVSSGVFPMPDYTKGVNKSCNTEYVAETSGWIYAYHYSEMSNYSVGVYIDGNFIKTTGLFFANLSGGVGMGIILPIAKGSKYSAVNLSTFVFYPVKLV